MLNAGLDAAFKSFIKKIQAEFAALNAAGYAIGDRYCTHKVISCNNDIKINLFYISIQSNQC